MSGGIDSSVVAILAKRALGDKVLGLILPCDSNPADGERAKLVADKFGIRTHRMELSPVLAEFRKILPEAGESSK